MGILFFPAGLFLVFIPARLLSRIWGITLAVVAYLCLAGFIWTMQYLETHHADDLTHTTALTLGPLVIYGLWGFIAYRIGKRQNYWPWPARIAWYLGGLAMLAWLAMGLHLFKLQWDLHHLPA